MIPRELDEKGIGEIVEGFAGAASRAKAAGYDGVEIEAAHGLLEYYDHMLRKLKDMAKEEGGSSGDIRPFLLSRLLD
jgi:sugar phosphate isomerase/epimerase